MSLAELKRNLKYQDQVKEWLDCIGSNDKQERDEVLELCERDKDAKRYFLKRWEEDVSKTSL